MLTLKIFEPSTKHVGMKIFGALRRLQTPRLPLLKTVLQYIADHTYSLSFRRFVPKNIHAAPYSSSIRYCIDSPFYVPRND